MYHLQTAAGPLDHGVFQYRIAAGEPLLTAYFALRRRIFCEEQQVFTGDDRDAWDDAAVPIVCITAPEGIERVVGVVRIYQESEGTWFGGRLGVDAAYRRVGKIGKGLVFKAVTTAHGRGCRKFLAIVQPQNVSFFRRMHWWARAEVEAHGRPHALMEADLAHYPPEVEVPAPDFRLVSSHGVPSIADEEMRTGAHWGAPRRAEP